MTTIHYTDWEQTKLSDDLKQIAKGIRRHVAWMGADASDEDIHNAGMIALGVLGAHAPLAHFAKNDGNVWVDHTAYVRSCVFLGECGFNTREINDLGVAPDFPYGML